MLSGIPLTFSVTVSPLPTVESAAVGFNVMGPAGSGFGEGVPVELGLDGTGEATIDTDGWPAGVYGYFAYCCGDPHLAPGRDPGFVHSDRRRSADGTASIPGDQLLFSGAIGVSVPATDGVGSGVRVVALSNDGVTWTEMLLPGHGLDIGTRRRAANGLREMARPGGQLVGRHVGVRDGRHGRGPRAAPVAAVVAQQEIAWNRVATAVRWSGGTENGSVAYRLERSTDGGAFALVQAGVTSTSLVASLTPGHSYRFRVRAVGEASDAGAWAYGSTLKLTAVCAGREGRPLSRDLGGLDELDLVGRHRAVLFDQAARRSATSSRASRSRGSA